ncbi:MAG TPA: alpha-ketoacid dehydrogenase subunit beta [Candidatus Paceibacterota bacterium]|nr:alpha-ketoacid dehydrogenase subunit beta [Candidatus Paceibacterota bacterium]
MSAMRVRQAIVSALADEMRADPSVMVFGEDVAVAEGPFKTSEGLLAEFGPLRVRDTPISEMGFTGAAVGAAMLGMKPVVEIMFVEFLGVALDQLVTEAAKMRYLSNGALSVPMVVRASCGSGLGFGSQHSQTLENWFAATPGLKVVSISDAQSAYSLMRAAIQDPDPVMVLEPRILYAERGEVDVSLKMEIGKARVLREGKEFTVVSLGQMVNVARQAIADSGIDAELIDLATVVPWDRQTVLDSVKKTGRLVVVEEAPKSGGWGSEIVASVTSQLFSHLKAAPFRITTPDTPVPYSGVLESRYIPTAEDISRQLKESLVSNQTPKTWWELEGLK